MIRSEMKQYNVIFTEKQQKYLRFDKLKLINMSILPVKKYLLSDQSRIIIIEQAQFTYSPLGKFTYSPLALQKQKSH